MTARRADRSAHRRNTETLVLLAIALLAVGVAVVGFALIHDPVGAYRKDRAALWAAVDTYYRDEPMFTPGFDGSEGGLEWNDRMAIVQVSIDMIRIKPDLPPDIAACVDILTGFPMTERQRFIDAFAACP